MNRTQSLTEGTHSLAGEADTKEQESIRRHPLANRCYAMLWESRGEGSDQLWGRQEGAEVFTEVVVSE